MNSIVLAILLMLILSVLRVNVVIALILSAIFGGLMSNLSFQDTLTAFNAGLGNGASITLAYALLGAFALAISNSGLAAFISNNISNLIHKNEGFKNIKYVLFVIIALISISSQNILPIHIAFIPIFIPPLIDVFNHLKIDRRLIACLLIFGLLSYSFAPIGFGKIYLNDILLKNIANNGVNIENLSVIKAMVIPLLGVFIGLLIAIFISYRNLREYNDTTQIQQKQEVQIKTKSLIVALCAIVASVAVQVLVKDAMILGALIGFMIFMISGELSITNSDDVFSQGSKMLANIGFVMIAAAGFASVMKATGEIQTLVESGAALIGNSKPLGILMMLIIGLLITMGIGSSFSTVPIIATIFVPLSLHLGLSDLAIVSLIGTAGVLGDAGSPASETTLGPTAGLNVDSKHNHIYDTVIPTFIHFNIPLLVFGFVAAMML